MAPINWKNPVNGDWSVAANWSTDAIPNLSDDVTISAPGSYIVTIGAIARHPRPPGGLLDLLATTPQILSTSDEANSPTLNAPQASLEEEEGTLSVQGALTLNSGSVSLNHANTIGSIGITGGKLVFQQFRRVGYRRPFP